jgi:hypothetical protein
MPLVAAFATTQRSRSSFSSSESPTIPTMNCSTCRFELSQCLDGRLPSGRRAIVMQHAGECSDCGTFWTELQAAQQLTLQLRQPRIGSDFRESLWARIQAGEGTPDAVFHEPVPLVVKLRYALTGAAAAAAALLCATWLAPGDAPSTQVVAKAEPLPGNSLAGGSLPGSPVPSKSMPLVPGAVGVAAGGRSPRVLHQDAPLVDEPPLQRLGFQLVAVEAAKQLEQRYTGTTSGLHRLANGDPSTTAKVVRDVLVNAEEFRDFGQLLLDLRDRQRLQFMDEKLESDLRFAVNMLAQTSRAEQDVETVRTFVAPALESTRLASVSRNLLVVPLEPGEEQDLVARMTIERPDTLAKLFVVATNPEALRDRVGLFRFVPFDERCELWVAPASRMQEINARRMVRVTGNGQHVELQIDVRNAPRDEQSK